jgi:hypothetical protein
LLPGSHLISFRDTRPSFISATFFCWYLSAPLFLAGVFSRAPLFRCFSRRRFFPRPSFFGIFSHLFPWPSFFLAHFWSLAFPAVVSRDLHFLIPFRQFRFLRTSSYCRRFL